MHGGGRRRGAARQPSADGDQARQPDARAHHAALLRAFREERLRRHAAWDSSSGQFLFLALPLMEAMLIHRIAPAGGGAPALRWGLAAAGLTLGEAALLAQPALLQPLMGHPAYLRWRTYLVLGANLLAAAVLVAQLWYTRQAAAASGLAVQPLLIIYSLRLLLSFQLHPLRPLPAAVLQLGVLSLVAGTCSLCQAHPVLHTHPAEEMFVAVAGALDRYSQLLAALVGLSYSHRSGWLGSAAGRPGNESLCGPVLLWYATLALWCLPVAYKMLAERAARRHYFRQHCCCPSCTHPNGTLLWVSLAPLAVWVPALLWQLAQAVTQLHN